MPLAAALAEHIARLPHPLGRLAVLKAVLIQVAQRDLHPFRAVRGDNRLFGNELAQVLADGLLHPLIVPQAVLEPPAAQLPGEVATTPSKLIALSHTTSPAPAGC